MFVEILIDTQPADFYCHLSAINESNERLFTIYSRFHPLSHIHSQVRRTDLTIISDTHVKKTRRPTGAFQWVQFCFLDAWIILWDSGEIAVVRWCCSAPGDARRQSNILHVTCLSRETPSRDTFFRLCQDFRRQPSLKMSEVIWQACARRRDFGTSNACLVGFDQQLWTETWSQVSTGGCE